VKTRMTRASGLGGNGCSRKYVSAKIGLKIQIHLKENDVGQMGFGSGPAFARNQKKTKSRERSMEPTPQILLGSQ